MVYTFARIGAVVGMKVEDYYPNGKRWWLRLHEKGGKFHEVPAHHNAEEYLDAYLEAAGIGDDKKGPLFRTAPGKTGNSRLSPLEPRQRPANDQAAGRWPPGSPTRICCHTFRATGITAYLENGGTIEKAQADRRPRVAADDQALRPHQRRDHARRNRADCDLRRPQRRPRPFRHRLGGHLSAG